MSLCVRMSVCPEYQASVFLAKQDTSGTQLYCDRRFRSQKKQTSAQSSYYGRSISVKRVNFRVRGFHLVFCPTALVALPRLVLSHLVTNPIILPIFFTPPQYTQLCPNWSWDPPVICRSMLGAEFYSYKLRNGPQTSQTVTIQSKWVVPAWH